VIKSWIFEFFATPAELAQNFEPAASQRFFDAYLELWALAECVGFDGIFFCEHHFGAGYSPAPHLLIASVALRTNRIRLGVMGVVPAYHTPWQLIEEIGMLDHLTRGRLEIGTAAGIPQEMARVGMSVDEARPRRAKPPSAARRSALAFIRRRPSPRFSTPIVTRRPGWATASGPRTCACVGR
jgi:alkanesulfonate monooxygenase SsuD/methylene tetrahydromethanopterin reductase-like flavin-dependent oxidoreductase (luciferase family)